MVQSGNRRRFWIVERKLASMNRTRAMISAAALLSMLTVSILVACGGSTPPVPVAVVEALVLQAEELVLQVGDSRQLAVPVLGDAEHDFSSFDGVSFQANELAGRIDQEGRFTAGTNAGFYPEAITVEYRVDSNITQTVTADVTIIAGALDRVSIEPLEATVQIGRSHQFSAAGFDRFDNLISDLTFVFDTDPQIGVINRGGDFIAGTTAGDYTNGVTVKATEGTSIQTANAGVFIVGPIDRLVLEPASLTIRVGQGRLFKVNAFDEFENPVPNSMFESVFEAMTVSGGISRWGFFSAGTHAGAFAEAVFVTVTQDDVTKRVSADINLTARPTNQVVMFPGDDFATQGLMRGFTAQGYDWFGNKVSEFTDLERFEEGPIDKTHVLRKLNNLLVWFEDGITNEEEADSTEKSGLEVILEIDLETGDFWVTVTGEPGESFDSTLRFNLNLVNERSGPSSNTSFGVSATLGTQIDSDSDNQLRYSGNNEALKVWRPHDRISTFGDAFFSGMSDGSNRLEATAFAIGNLSPR